MNNRNSVTSLLLPVMVITMMIQACNTENIPETMTVKEVSFDGDAAGMPWLVSLGNGGVAMSWTRTENGIPRLEYSRYEDGSWSAPDVIAEQQEREEWFVNWADFPSVVELDDGRMAANYLVSSGENIFAYDVHITSTGPDGNWMPSVVPHTDGTQTEHGFVSLLPWQNDEVMAVWLDGRNTSGGHYGHGGGPMTLRSAVIGPEGLSHEFELDSAVCDCCQTSAVRLPGDGALVVYRDRTPDEIRDISFVRFRDGTWEEPRVLHHDGWEIFGCPVNGPAIDAIGETVAVAWFTQPGDTARVKVAFSGDGGDNWSSPVQTDTGQPLGRVDILMLDDQRALLSWISQDERDARIMVRVVHRSGELGPPVVISSDDGLSTRASGFPRMAKYGSSGVIIAWTAVDGERRSVKVRMITITG
ncbi:MAG: glycoside hydrolase [Rhodothermaceae bacterium]|nr:glycoside hydrolase [Rhodothermaceae bacterium]